MILYSQNKESTKDKYKCSDAIDFLEKLVKLEVEGNFYCAGEIKIALSYEEELVLHTYVNRTKTRKETIENQDVSVRDLHNDVIFTMNEKIM